jgi:hypothetical protein
MPEATKTLFNPKSVKYKKKRDMNIQTPYYPKSFVGREDGIRSSTFRNVGYE